VRFGGVGQEHLVSLEFSSHSTQLATFEEHVQRSHATLHVLAGALVGRSDAADLVQEACIVGMSRFGAFVPGTNFNAWMGAIIRNLALNHRRGEKRRMFRMRLFSAARPEVAERQHSGPDTASDERLLSVVNSLDDEQRACFLLKVVREHSYAEIGAILAIPEATARSHVFRARKQLLGQLSPKERSEHD
jgi:RNA polymerase sigma-70 factor (ECF subfamily)